MAGYGDDAGFTTWLAANGLTLPDDSPTEAVLRERGSVYIDATYGPRFTGTPTDPDQEREWPRTDAYIYGDTLIADDVIPNRVVTASYHAAYISATNPGALSVGYNTNALVKRERVEGAVEVEYFESGASASGTVGYINPMIEGLLAPLLVPVDAFPMVMVV